MQRRDIIAMGFVAATPIGYAHAQDTLNVAELVERVARDLPATLSTQLARIGLLSFANQYLFAREQVRPLGYEQSPEFLILRARIAEALSARFLRSEITIPSIPVFSGTTLDRMQRAYVDNRSQIDNVFNALRNHPNSTLLRVLSNDEILRYIAAFALAIRWANESVWAQIDEWTGFWPFCVRRT